MIYKAFMVVTTRTDKSSLSSNLHQFILSTKSVLSGPPSEIADSQEIKYRRSTGSQGGIHSLLFHSLKD